MAAKKKTFMDEAKAADAKDAEVTRWKQHLDLIKSEANELSKVVAAAVCSEDDEFIEDACHRIRDLAGSLGTRAGKIARAAQADSVAKTVRDARDD